MLHHRKSKPDIAWSTIYVTMAVDELFVNFITFTTFELALL